MRQLKILSILFFALSGSVAYAQVEDTVGIDGSIEVRSEEDFDRMAKFFEKTIDRQHKDEFFFPAEYLEYAENGVDWARTHGNRMQYLFARYFEIKCYLDEADHEKVIEVGVELIGSNRFKEQPEVLFVLEDLRSTYLITKDFTALLDLYPTYYELNKKHGKTVAKTDYLSNRDMAYAYYKMKNYHKAIEYGKRRLKFIDNEKSLVHEASALNDLGLFYMKLNEWDTAVMYYDQSLATMEKLFAKEGRESEFSRNFYNVVASNKADYWYETGQYQRALPFYLKELATIKMDKQLDMIAKCYLNVARVYYGVRNFGQCRLYLDSSLSVATLTTAPEQYINGLKLKSKLLMSSGDMDEADQLMKRTDWLVDSFDQDERSKGYLAASLRYEFEKKQTDLDLAEQQVLAQKNKTLFSTIGLIASAVVALIFFFIYRRVARDKKIISDQKAAAELAIQEKELLIREIHHRVKNNLQIVSGMLDLQLSKFDDPEYQNVVEEAQRCIHSMSLVHQMLYKKSTETRIELNEYLSTLIESIRVSYMNRDVNFELDLKHYNVSIDSAIPLGLITTELITNAFKHAFKDKPGKIIIRLDREGEQYHFTYSDNGVGLPPDFNFRSSKTLGMRLMKLLAEEMGTHLNYDTHDGLKISLKFTDNVGLNERAA